MSPGGYGLVLMGILVVAAAGLWRGLARREGPDGQVESARPAHVALLVLALIFAARLLNERVSPSPEAPPWLPASVGRWWPTIAAAADAHGVDPALVAIVMLVESHGEPSARSSAGALGLMQVVPRFHPVISAGGADPFDPRHNIHVGTRILADNLRACAVGEGGGDHALTVRRAAARYNGGSCTADRSYAETRTYVRLVGGMWSERRQPRSVTYDQWAGFGR